jgi:hypothetical protein
MNTTIEVPGENSPMYFKSLELVNIKCFGQRAILDLCDKNGAISPWTLILGDNGVGKTTILKCLAWMVPVIDPPTAEEEKKKAEDDKGKTPEQIKAEELVRIKPYLDDLQDEDEFEKLIRVGADTRSQLKACFSVGTLLGGVPDDSNVVSLGIDLEREAGKLEKVDLHKDFLKDFNPPNLFAYGANRHMGMKNVDEAALRDPILNLFSDYGALYDAEEVLATLEYASLKPETSARGTSLFNKVKKILADLLPDIESPDSIVISSPLRSDSSLGKSRVEVITPYGKVSILELSLGYKTMLAWTLDLALRMFWQNPDAENPLEAPAVVIMDEIDLHLHPKWQRDIREFLTFHFKKTQFVCTAHSPFMAQASADDNFSVLHRLGPEATIQNDPVIVKTWRIGQFATSELFEVGSERAKEIEGRVNRRRDLLDKRDRNAVEEAELKALDKELADLPIDAEGPTLQLINELQEFSALVKSGGAKL